MWVGNKDKGTPLHLDRTEAYNLAIAIQGHGLPAFNPLEPVAYWLFIAPSLLDTAQAWIKDTLKRRPDQQMTYTDMVQIRDALAYLNGPDGRNSKPPLIFIEPQWHLGLIHVTPGWAHAVCNHQACLKVAWDAMVPNRMGAYGVAQRFLARGRSFHSPHTARDYMGCVAVEVAFCKGQSIKSVQLVQLED